MQKGAVMDSRIEQVVDEQPYPLLFVTVSGAHLYGFPSLDSDYDLRGVHLLPVRELVGLREPLETIELSEEREGLEIDLVTHDAKKFFKMMLKRNGYVLEQLFSPLIVRGGAYHEELKQIARGCVTRHHVYHYLGFARNQWYLFEKEQERRVKPLLYVFRVLLTGIWMMKTGEVEANLLTLNEEFNLPYISELVERKLQGSEQGTLKEKDIIFYQMEYERLLNELVEAAEESRLQQEPSGKELLHDLLLRLRLG